MKRIVLLLLSFVFVWSWVSVDQAEADPGKVRKLMDRRIFAQGCQMGGPSGNIPSCADLDNDPRASFINEIEVNTTVPGGGMLALYFDDLNDYGTDYRGGFQFEDAIFVNPANEETKLDDGVQIFYNGGKLRLKFDQPYHSDGRAVMNYRFILYFLPHESGDLTFFNQMEKARFTQYIREHRRDIEDLCDELRLERQVNMPWGCEGGFEGDARVISSPTDVQVPGKRFVEFTMLDYERWGFIHQPITLEIKNLIDPDGLCDTFDFQWSLLRNKKTSVFEQDDERWSLLFVPLETGTYTLRLRIKEECGIELGTATSPYQTIIVHVNDRAVDFQDVNDAPGYQPFMMDLYLRGVMTGYSDGTMRPNDFVNRAEFLKMLFEILRYEIPLDSYSAHFFDVPSNVWFSPYIYEADRLGVVQGYSDGFFRPAQTVNLVEALKMMLQFTDIEVKESLEYLFGDFDFEDWFSRYIQTAYREGILDDIEPGENVFPGQPITRAVAAKLLVRTFINPINRINQVNQGKVK
jgi:hypothetical protein